ncbi:hypothetical protein [Paraclostridium bifermentans]|uniref:hypothetical protein n=1 Tax=Paraclostridium bifermentans TaxID=1490 RepID=UPI00374EE2C0
MTESVKLDSNLIQEEFICRKGEARMLGNLLRHLTIASSPCWRPIAISLDKEGTNVLHSSGDVVQSMLEIRQSFVDLQFEVNCDDDDTKIVMETYTFGKELNSNDLSKGRVKCITPNVPIINMLSEGENTITVYFRNGYGVCTLDQNQNFLQKGEKINTLGNINVIPSVHTENDKFTFVVEENSLDTEKLIVGINNKYNTMTTEGCKEVLSKTLNRAIETLQSMVGQI